MGTNNIQINTGTHVFTEELFKIAKRWKQSQCPSVNEWTKQGVLFSHKKNEVLIHATR